MSLHTALRNIGRVSVCMSACTDGVSRVVEGRRNRCTRQRDADRRAIPLFFSRPLFCSSSFSSFTSFLSLSLARSAIALPSKPLSLSNPPLSLSNLLTFIAATTWLPVARGFRSDVGMIEKSIRTGRSYIPRCRCCHALLLF